MKPRKEPATTIRDDTSDRHTSKYENQNLIHRLVLGRFLNRVAAIIESLEIVGETLDFGCGEAYFWEQMRQRGISPAHLIGIDLRQDALIKARQAFPSYDFLEQDLLTWNTANKFELVIASQVMEHLRNPNLYLEKLVSISDKYLLLTVPWEPFFRLSNLTRGRDILRLGNHPEHVNLWGASQFERLVKNHANIIKSETIFPFLIVVAKPR